MRPKFACLALSLALSACAPGASDDLADGPKTDDTNASADTCERGFAFQVPLLAEGADGIALMSSLNEAIEDAGFTGFPDAMRVTPDDAGREAFSRWREHVELLTEAADLGVETIGFSTPDKYRAEKVALCFEGDVASAPDAITDLVDNVFSDQLGLAAWRTVDQEVVDEDFVFDENIVDDEFPAEWESFSPEDEHSILVITVSSDSGDDYTATIIPRCEGQIL
jgi:hypothetical protein